jgi:hypothetical protein
MQEVQLWHGTYHCRRLRAPRQSTPKPLFRTCARQVRPVKPLVRVKSLTSCGHWRRHWCTTRAAKAPLKDYPMIQLMQLNYPNIQHSHNPPRPCPNCPKSGIFELLSAMRGGLCGGSRHAKRSPLANIGAIEIGEALRSSRGTSATRFHRQPAGPHTGSRGEHLQHQRGMIFINEASPSSTIHPLHPCPRPERWNSTPVRFWLFELLWNLFRQEGTGDKL